MINGKGQWWLEWMGILAGCLIMATGFVLFINPYNIVPGGVYGASIVMHNIFPGVQVGTFGYMFDIPLLLLSVLFFGSKLGVRTIAAALITPLLMNALSLLAYPTQAALESLDPSLLLGGRIDLSDHLLLTTIFGSLLIGVASGLIVRCQATSGGTDTLAMIAHKYTHIRYSTAVLLIDALVVLAGLIVIGFGVGGSAPKGEPQIHLSLYSLIAVYMTSRVIAYVLNGAKDDKLLLVITERPIETFHRYILDELERTATIVKSSGLYSREDRQLLFLVISYKEVALTKAKIREADPTAFVIVTDAYDTYGDGWKPLPEKGDLQPE